MARKEDKQWASAFRTFLIEEIRLTPLTYPNNEGVWGKSFPPAGSGVEPRQGAGQSPAKTASAGFGVEPRNKTLCPR